MHDETEQVYLLSKYTYGYGGEESCAPQLVSRSPSELAEYLDKADVGGLVLVELPTTSTIRDLQASSADHYRIETMPLKRELPFKELEKKNALLKKALKQIQELKARIEELENPKEEVKDGSSYTLSDRDIDRLRDYDDQARERVMQTAQEDWKQQLFKERWATANDRDRGFW